MTDEILNADVIRRALKKGIKITIAKAFEEMRRKLNKVDMVDNIIEDVIPRKISGDKRARLKDLIRKRLKEEGAIK